MKLGYIFPNPFTKWDLTTACVLFLKFKLFTYVPNILETHSQNDLLHKLFTIGSVKVYTNINEIV